MRGLSPAFDGCAPRLASVILASIIFTQFGISHPSYIFTAHILFHRRGAETGRKGNKNADVPIPVSNGFAIVFSHCSGFPLRPLRLCGEGFDLHEVLTRQRRKLSQTTNPPPIVMQESARLKAGPAANSRRPPRHRLNNT